MMYNTLVAIDIGLSGGIAFFDLLTKEVLSLYSMPTESITSASGKEKRQLDIIKLRFILEIPKCHAESALVLMENVHAFPGQGVVATATLMEQRGIIRGLSCGLGYDVEFVEPKSWQKHFNLIPPKDLRGKSATQTKTLRKKWLKSSSLELARVTFPEWAEDKLNAKGAHGLSDALLIGRWYMDFYKI